MLAVFISLPSFIFFISGIYWIPVLSVLTGSLKWWNLLGPRNDIEAMVEVLMWLFRVRVVVAGSRRLHRAQRTMYMPNHRSFADFFIDQRLMESRGATLSRYAVAVVFPMVMLSSTMLRSIILFVRGGRRVREKEGFNAWLDAKLAKSSYNSFMIYPEGHRSTRERPLELKRGMLKYAYTRGMKVQPIISANKEAVLSEKQLRARFGQTVVVGYGEVVDPAAYPDFEPFMAAVQRAWDAEWEGVFAADPQGLPELAPAVVDMELPLGVRLRQNAFLVAGLAYFYLMLRACVRLAFWAVALLGPTASWVLGAAVIAWCVVSAYVCSRPYDARKRRRQQEAAAAAGGGTADAGVAAEKKKEG